MAVIYRGRRLPAAFGSFVSFGVWRKLQPQNIAGRYFDTFGVWPRQPTTFGPSGTRGSATLRPASPELRASDSASSALQTVSCATTRRPCVSHAAPRGWCAHLPMSIGFRTTKCRRREMGPVGQRRRQDEPAWARGSIVLDREPDRALGQRAPANIEPARRD